MSTVKNVDFVGATDPGLTPEPFDSVNEGSGNDVKFGAAVGNGGGPGMEVDLGGTTKAANGQWDLVDDIDVDADAAIASFFFDIRVAESGLVSPNAVDVYRLRESGGNDTVFTAMIQAQLTDTLYVFQLEDHQGTGGIVTGAQRTEGVWYSCELRVSGPEQKAFLYVDGTLDITVDVAAAVNVINEVRIGTVTGATPLATGAYFYDNLRIDDGLPAPPTSSTVTSSGAQSFGLTLGV